MSAGVPEITGGVVSTTTTVKLTVAVSWVVVSVNTHETGVEPSWKTVPLAGVQLTPG